MDFCFQTTFGFGVNSESKPRHRNIDNGCNAFSDDLKLLPTVASCSLALKFLWRHFLVFRNADGVFDVF